MVIRLVFLISWSAIVKDLKKCNKEVKIEWLPTVKEEQFSREGQILLEVKTEVLRVDQRRSRIVMIQEADHGLNNGTLQEIENLSEDLHCIRDQGIELLLDKLKSNKAHKLEEQVHLKTNIQIKLVNIQQLNKSHNFRIKHRLLLNPQLPKKWTNTKLL